jgi:hypothetical protein
MTKVEALTFIYSHGSDILAADFAEDLAQVFGYSLGDIGIDPMAMTEAFPIHPLPGWEGRLTVHMPYLAAALAGMGSMPSQATEEAWNAISRLSAEALEHGHDVEHGVGVEQIKLHVHFEVHDKDEPVKESGETLPQSA